MSYVKDDTLHNHCKWCFTVDKGNTTMIGSGYAWFLIYLKLNKNSEQLGTNYRWDRFVNRVG